MKKSLLALFIASSLVLTGCDDQKNEALNQKLQQAEQQISVLKAKLAKNSEKPTASSEKVEATFPALQVEIYPLFEKSEVVKFSQEERKKQEDEFGISREEAEVSRSIELAKTGVDWLDNLIAVETLKDYRSENDKTALDHPLTQLKKLAEDAYQADFTEVKSGSTFAMQDNLTLFYVGQRNNIVTFRQFYYSFTGGAHGIYGSRYLNIDVNKKSVITLNDFVPEANQAKLKAALWEAYVARTQKQNGGEKAETYIEKADFEVSSEFIFTPEGVRFVYPPYAIGAYAEGEIELEVDWYTINPLLNVDYQRTAKDGFTPNEIQ